MGILSSQFAPYPLIKNGDVLDLFTPLVLIPLYWLLFQIHRDRQPSQKEMLVFLLMVVLWVEGQGMHLVGNSIGHLTQGDSGSEIEMLTYFYDEILSHYVWHLGLVGVGTLDLSTVAKPFFESTFNIEVGDGSGHYSWV